MFAYFKGHFLAADRIHNATNEWLLDLFCLNWILIAKQEPRQAKTRPGGYILGYTI
jgi:hypothetical protein